MIEKMYDKVYVPRLSHGDDIIPQSTLTRIANRLLKEYKEVDRCSDSGIPDEIKAIAEKIKAAADSDEYEYESTFDTPAPSDRTYDSCKNTYEYRAHAFWDTDEYGDAVYHITWYFFTSEYYSKFINGKKITAGNYQDITRKVAAEKGKYRYFCTHRPPARGVIPEGFVSYDTYGRGERYIGEVTYNEKPADTELQNWGLVYDPDYERVRAYWLSEDNA